MIKEEDILAVLSDETIPEPCAITNTDAEIIQHLRTVTFGHTGKNIEEFNGAMSVMGMVTVLGTTNCCMLSTCAFNSCG